jgi:hypothetical protein
MGSKHRKSQKRLAKVESKAKLEAVRKFKKSELKEKNTSLQNSGSFNYLFELFLLGITVSLKTPPSC